MEDKQAAGTQKDDAAAAAALIFWAPKKERKERRERETQGERQGLKDKSCLSLSGLCNAKREKKDCVATGDVRARMGKHDFVAFMSLHNTKILFPTERQNA